MSPDGQVLPAQLELRDAMVEMVKNMEWLVNMVDPVLMVNKVFKVHEVRSVQTGKVEFQVHEDQPVREVYKEILGETENKEDQELSAPGDRQVFREKLANKVTRVGQVSLVRVVNQEFKADGEISETPCKLLRVKKVFGGLWDHPASRVNKAHPA